jgi:hypothetical protein
LFVERVLRGAAREHRAEAARLRSAVAVPRGQLHLGYRSLVARFAVEFAGFERKAYVNLSHEPNKAMNLNSYLGLLGGAWREVAHPDGLHLVPAADDGADLVVREAAYVLTLDADSVLVPSYAARLVECLERPGHERVAVVQTPYSAFPGAPGALERMAGATTDMQFIVHQGFTRHGATFWVGANALIRWRALAELARHETERGHTVVRFIQDRTVIEDTESSVDLLAAGWQLHNYPRRLSWSATPPDFGALVIQRRRWANGGLVILPKLLRHLLRTRSERGRDSGGWMRVHYLSSIAGVNIGLILLLDVPLPTPAATCWLPVAAAPYFAMYARDLRQAGYRMRDVARVYALNLLLVPVNLAGVAKSVQQGLTRSKIPFGRTPKINGRTRVPVLYLLAPLVLSALWTLRAGLDLAERHWVHAGCVLLNVAAMTYAVARFIGGRALLADLRASTTARLRPARTARIVAPRRPTADDASSRI